MLSHYLHYYIYNNTSSNVIVSKSNMNEWLTGKVFFYFDEHVTLMEQINQIDWKDK